MANANKLFDGRNDSIKFVDDYTLMILEAKKTAAKEELEPELWKAPSKAKTKRKKSPLELREEYINEIENDEKNTIHIFSKKNYVIATKLQMIKL